MLKIGEFSKVAKTTIKTLRFYDEIDLFKPFFVDDNGYRYYDVGQLDELMKIIELRSLDVSIDDIKSIIAGENVVNILENHLNALITQSKRIKHNISLIKNCLANAKKGEPMKNYTAEIIDIPEYVVYKKHGVIKSMNDLFNFVLSAGAEVRKNNPTLECCDYCYITYTAQEFKENDVELEYVEAVKTSGKESENVKFDKIPSCKVINVAHKGSYMGLGKAYSYALKWMNDNGYNMVAPIREVYVDGCWNKDSEDDYLTLIQIPIAIN